jgi:hypothetical protein
VVVDPLEGEEIGRIHAPRVLENDERAYYVANDEEEGYDDEPVVVFGASAAAEALAQEDGVVVVVVFDAVEEDSRRGRAALFVLKRCETLQQACALDAENAREAALARQAQHRVDASPFV